MKLRKTFVLGIGLSLAVAGFGASTFISPKKASAAGEWTDITSLSQVTGANQYRLMNDITLTSAWHPFNGSTLDLNGYGIKQTGTDSVIFIDSSNTFTLVDNNETRTGGTNRPSGIVGGYITGGKGTNYNQNTNALVGGGVYLAPGPTVFNMYGGSIAYNTATYGAAVYLDFNNATEAWYATFNFYSGTVCYCTSLAISVREHTRCNIGGTDKPAIIRNNDYGVQIWSGISCRLGNNTYIINNTMWGLTNDCRFFENESKATVLSGKVVITGNGPSGQAKDAWFYDKYNPKFAIDGTLAEDSLIGIYLTDYYTENWKGPLPYTFLSEGATSANERCFFSNTSKYGVTRSGSSLIMGNSNDCIVNNFVNKRLYMNLNVTGQCNEYYADAKADFNALSAAQRQLFCTSSDFAAAYARLCAWATAKGESIGSNYVLSSNKIFVASAKDNTSLSVTLVIIVAVTLAAFTGAYFLSRKRKEN